MSRWIEYWENTIHEDGVSENLGTEDLVAKGKFSFLDNKIKLSAKTKINSDPVLSTSSDYSLTHKVSPMTTYILTHKAKEITLDGNWALHQKDKVFISLYTKLVLEQNEKKRAIPVKVHVRIHHDDNKIFSIGLEDYDVLNNPNPNDISLYGIVGHDFKNGYKGWKGINVGFKLSTNQINYHKWAFGVKHQHYSVSLETAFIRIVKADKSIESRRDDGERVSEFEKVMDLRADGNLNKDLKIGGDVKFNIDSKKVETKAYATYKIDGTTSLKARLENYDTLTLGLTHTYRQLITFGFISRLKLSQHHAKEGETTHVHKTHVKSKFGLSLEFNDTAPLKL